jgi:hypothetical protein
LHTKEAHESYLMSKNLISRLAGQEKEKKNGAALLSAGLALSSIWEKQGLEVGKGRWREKRNRGLCSARGETTCGLGCRRGSSHHSPIFCLIMMKVGAEDQELG